MASEDFVEARLTGLLALPASDDWPGTQGVTITVASDPDTDMVAGYTVTVAMADGGSSPLFAADTLGGALDKAYTWATSEGKS